MSSHIESHILHSHVPHHASFDKPHKLPSNVQSPVYLMQYFQVFSYILRMPHIIIKLNVVKFLVISCDISYHTFKSFHMSCYFIHHFHMPHEVKCCIVICDVTYCNVTYHISIYNVTCTVMERDIQLIEITSFCVSSSCFAKFHMSQQIP